MSKGGGGSIGSGSMEAAAKMFQGSGGARKALFKQLASALQTGGRGIRSGVVQQAMARSQAAGRNALMGAGNTFAGGTTPSNVQGRVLNRISRVGEQNTAGIAPAFAGALAAKAPAAIFGAADAQAGMSGIQMQGEAGALQAAATRGQGWANAASSVASSAGYAASNWMQKYFDKS